MRSLAPNRRHQTSHVRSADASCVDAVTLGSLTLPNPVVTASGTYGHGDEVARLGDPRRLGAITAKSVSSVTVWQGKPAPRLHMTAAGMLNAVGLQGPGVAAWIEHDLPGAARHRRARHRVGLGTHRRRLRRRRRVARRRSTTSSRSK